MYLKKNIEENVTIEVSSEAAENILSILGFGKTDDAVARVRVYSDQFVDFLSKAMSAVIDHQTIVLTKDEAHEIIIEFVYEIVTTFNKPRIDDIRGSANSRYAALLGETGLIPRMVAMGIISKTIADVIYRYDANNAAAAVVMLDHLIAYNMPGVNIRRSFVRTCGRYNAYVAMMKKQKTNNKENKAESNVGVKAKVHSTERKAVVKKVISIQRGIINVSSVSDDEDDADSDGADLDWDDDELNDPNPANTDLMHDVDDDEDNEDYVPNTGYNQDVHDPVGDTHLCVTKNNVNSLWFDVSKMETPRRAAWQEVLAQTFTKAINEGKAPMDLLFLDSHGHLCWRSDKPVWEIEGIGPMDYCSKLSYEASVDYKNIMHCAQNPDVIVLGRMDAIAMKSIFDQILEMNACADDIELWGNRALATERLHDVLTGYVYGFDRSAVDVDDDE